MGRRTFGTEGAGTIPLLQYRVQVYLLPFVHGSKIHRASHMGADNEPLSLVWFGLHSPHSGGWSDSMTVGRTGYRYR